MTKEEVIGIITKLYPGKKITNLIEFPDTYVFDLDDQKTEGLVNWKSINKKTGKFEYTSFFELDDSQMTKLI